MCDFLRRKGLCFWLMKIFVILVDEKIGLPRPDFKKIAFCIFWFCLNLHKRHAEALHAKMPRNAVILAIFYQNYACETPILYNRRVSKNVLIGLLQTRRFRKNAADYLKESKCRSGQSTNCTFF